MSQSNRNFRLSEALLRGKEDSDKTKIEDAFKSSKALLRSLADRIEKNLEDKILDSESVKQYLNFNWAEYQADNRGYRRALRDVLNLFVEYK